MQYGGNSAAPIFYRAVAYHGILSYICRMNEKLLFRRARPADTERIMEIIRQAQALGKRVAVPKVYGDTMKFLWLDDLNAVAPGAYNIPEPIADGPEADDETALVLMPGLAFDPEGHRCGYGGGFYDKFLAAHPAHPTLALCYGFQMFDHLETDDYDIPVDAVISAEVDE